MSAQRPPRSHLAYAAGVLAATAAEWRAANKPRLPTLLDDVGAWLMELAAADDDYQKENGPHLLVHSRPLGDTEVVAHPGFETAKPPPTPKDPSL